MGSGQGQMLWGNCGSSRFRGGSWEFGVGSQFGAGNCGFREVLKTGHELPRKEFALIRGLILFMWAAPGSNQ